ncbi:MAG: type II secretion system protein N [Gammaproteobacteria bacterium]|nr:type II secretion system protein N [Gammaproteobacteria bacterium]
MSKKRWLLYAIFGLIFYFLFLVIEMPASWFAWGLNRYTQGTVRLDPIAGGLWHGNGRLVIYYPQTVPHEFGQTEWSINPLWLFAGRVQMQWRTESAETHIHTTLRFGNDQMQLLETEIAFPAQAVSTFYSPASLISPKGQVLVRTDKLMVVSDGVEGSAEISWRNASSDLSTVQPLGDYRLEINGVGKTAALKLSTARGDLELTGQGQWQISTGQIQFTGSAAPREHASELEPLLKLLGSGQGNGKRPLTINTRLLPPV